MPGLPVWDAAFYYAYMRSAVLDGDQQLDDDFQILYAHLPNDDASVRRQVDQERTATDYVKSTLSNRRIHLNVALDGPG